MTADRAGETARPAEDSTAGTSTAPSEIRKRPNAWARLTQFWPLFRGKADSRERAPRRLGQLIFAMRHSRELLRRLDFLESDHRRLLDEISDREKIAAERELAQEKLRESEAKLRKIFDACVDAVAITRLSDGHYLDVNKAFELTGFTHDEVLGSDVGKLNVWADPAQQRRFLQTLKNDGRVSNMEVGFRRKDGVVVPYLISATVVELGGVPCVASVAHDITESKLIRGELMTAREALSARVEALQQSDRRLRDEVVERELTQQKLLENTNALRKIIEVSPDTITVNRLGDGSYIDIYPDCDRIFGYSREDVLKSVPSKIVWIHREEFRQFLKQLQEHGAVRNMQTEFHTKDATIIPVEVSAALVDLDGERCVITFTKDMRERKRFERELIAAREEALKASQSKSEFLSRMSHDIRTPMNAILGMADLLWETPLNFEQRRYLDTMRANGNTLLDLINGILDLSRIESGRISLELAPFDPADLVEKVLDSLAIRGHEKRLELVAQISPDFPAEVVGDSLRLRQVLVNLVDNAIKFTEHGEVVLAAESIPPPDPASGALPGQQMLRFTVIDSGIGIPADKLGAVFGCFEQAESSTTRRYGGSGLGLAIAKSLVELMGGDITVTSTPGQGSSFSFALSLEIRAKSRNVLDRIRDEIGHRDFRALVFDDSATARLALSQTLRAAGVAVSQADNVDQALELIGAARASAKPFDLLLLDYGPPEANGLTLARRIPSAGAAAREAIVMMLTSDALAAMVAQLQLDAKISGRWSYLVKPVKRADLFEKIINVIGQQRHRLPAHAPALDYDAPQLRRASHAPAGAPDKAASAAVKVIARPIRVLLAEDSADNRLLIEAYLKNTPYVLDCAENGQLAIDRATSAHYDVILMDIQMPVLDGYTAVRKIREWEHEHGGRATPIIALTASALDEAVRKSFDAGCNGHVSKPVKKATLIEAIRTAIDASREASERASTGEDA